MYIKNFESTRFAGLKDINLNFEEGLNVILGPNESGKSSLIEGIHSTLFKHIKLRGNRNIDKDFIFKFMPRPDGDFIDASVTLATEKGDYKISKEWGSSEDIEFVTPDGNIIKKEKDVNRELKKLLSFGESTYSNIVFAKQSDLKKAIFNIIEDEEISREVNDVLRRALMELDGVSIDKIERNMEEEIELLFKRWDIEKNYPQNNRGINHPYKVGLGKIIKSYYYKEGLKLKMDRAKSGEFKFEEISNRINSLKLEEEKKSSEKKKLEEIESDINDRAILETEINSIKRELEDLMEANKNWPLTENQLETLEDKKSKLKEKREKLLIEKKEVDKAKRKSELEGKLTRLEEVEEKIEELNLKIDDIPELSDEDLEELEAIKSRLFTIKTTMEAGRMMAKVKKDSGGKISILRDLDEEIAPVLNESIEANGYIRVNYNDEFEFEIKTGEADFEKLSLEYRKLEENYDNKLEELKIESLEEGKANLERIKTKTNNLNILKNQEETIRDASSLEELKKELKSLENVKVNKEPDEIEEELESTSLEEVNILSDKKSKKNEIKNWIDRYESFDNLFDLVVDKKMDLRKKTEKLDGLSHLPKNFESADAFRKRLTYLRSELTRLQDELGRSREEYYQAKSNLSDETYEELKKESLHAEESFKRLMNRGKKLLKIRRVFYETKERLESDPMESLVAEFERLLNIITDGDYSSGSIDEDFKIKLEDGSIPIELLSAGTHDAVTLALRFALLKHIFDDNGGYVLLDDSLVDLDPRRKKQSINLIKEFSRDYQIIFTTCNPETARMLGGNIINF